MILSFAPWMMKTLSVLGTAAMFLVGGGITVVVDTAVADLGHARVAGRGVVVAVTGLAHGHISDLIDFAGER